jgi:hypothetical protein
MWIGRALVNDFIEVKEACRRDAFLAESIEAITTVVGEKPACAEGDCSRSRGDLGGRVLLERGVQLFGSDEI